jgi:ornithine cyclodeaminase
VLDLDAKTLASALPYAQLIEVLAKAFAADIEVPPRAHIEIPVPGGTAGNLLLMPAWQAGGSLGVKIVTVFPDNAKDGRPAVFASYVLMSAKTGVPIAILDGSELTLRRTAAASALASGFLSRKDSATLLMVGTGNLAPHLVVAHATARPIKEVLIWGRRAEAAAQMARRMTSATFAVSVAADLEDAVARADIVSCATLASEPLIRGAWLRPGQHLDLVGAFRPDMREVDTEALLRASLYVDTRAGALCEAGEIVQALQSGSITVDSIKGELRDLATGKVPGREDEQQITLFKSVGTALEDLAAAELAVRNVTSAGSAQVSSQ